MSYPPFHGLDTDELQNLFSSKHLPNANESRSNIFSELDDSTYLDFIEPNDDIFHEQLHSDPDRNFLSDVHNQCTYVQNLNLADEITANKQFDLTIMELNIQSLPKNHDALEILIAPIRENVQIIMLVETWLTKSTIDCYELKGFRSEKCIRNKKRGGGTAVFIQHKLTYEKLTRYCCTTDNYEFLFLKIKKSNTYLDKDVIISTCYRPPNGDINIFLIKLTEILYKITLNDNYISQMILT